MIRINLLPIRVKKKQELARQFVSIYFVSIGLLLGVMGFLWWSSSNEIETLNARIAQVKAETAKYARFELALQELTKRKEIVDKKRDLIKNLQTDRSDKLP